MKNKIQNKLKSQTPTMSQYAHAHYIGKWHVFLNYVLMEVP